MKLRRIEWEDLNIKVGWRIRNGTLRVYVSLKGCAFVNHLFWLKDFDPSKAETRVAILLVLRRKFLETAQRMDAYLEDSPSALPISAVTKILAARDALLKSDMNEAYHQLYGIADPFFKSFEPWRQLETQTGEIEVDQK